MSDRVREFGLGPEQARALYTHGAGEKRMDSAGRVIQVQGIGSQIGHGTYRREDVQQRMAERQPARLPMKLPPAAKPHEQTEAQFEKDPRTWFHGEYTPPGAEDTGSQSWQSGGFHVGSLAAATDRLKQVGPGNRVGRSTAVQMGTAPRMQGQVVAGRIHDRVRQPLVPDAGDNWASARTTRLYENDSEARGSISAVLPSRSELRTHQEAVHEHLMGQQDPQKALEGLRPRVRAEYEARGGRVGADRHEDLLADLEGRPSRGGPAIGRQFSSYQSYEHPDEVAERPKTHEQLSLLKQVKVGSTSHELAPGDYEKFSHAMGYGYDAGAGPPKMPVKTLKAKLGKAKPAFG